jgi:hypothetical protein
MLHPQIVVHERDGRLAEQLRPLAAAERWALREPRQAEHLWHTLRDGGPTVFVVKLREPPRDLELIERVTWELPDVATVVVGDPENADVLSGLSWDAGAAFALFPPISRDLLPEIVAGLMRRAIKETLPAESAS